MVGRAPQQGQGIGQPDFVWLRGLAGGNNLFTQSATGLVGGGQAGATPIGSPNSQGTEATLIQLAAVASANDSFQLPQAIKGKLLFVFNSTVNSANVFASPQINRQTSALDTINGAANATANAIAGAASTIYFCPVDGLWAAK